MKLSTSVPATVKPLSGVLGAEISGIDLSQKLSTELFNIIHQAFLDHHVLVFRNQTLTPEQQMRFGRYFGELDFHPFVEGNTEFPELLNIVTEPDDQLNFGGGWHTDVTFLAEPDLGSILYGIELPAYGGDTLFSSQVAAYNTLSDPMKEMLGALTATHAAAKQYRVDGPSTKSKAMNTNDTDPAAFTVSHPVIRTHPETGRKALYVNSGFTTRINGVSRDESKMLLDFLLKHAVQERFTCRVAWEPGTLVMWDNRCVQHHALHDYAGQRRHVRRITVKGDQPR
ncbi:MAG: TauD/TfdA family dioxygenase [Acidimicrobiales bacterium]|nr:TauD/TfdA family dioxygenase [Acidimicrobiales bacterium]MDG2216706.1 TauD/TfdA family dioxygenase [Acidimicrobiales bacterium]